MQKRFPLSVACCVAFLFMAFTANTSWAQSLFWDATAERNGVLMESTYSELYYNNGELVDQQIEVRVWNAPPNIQLKVIVRGTAIGVLRTNADGFGRFYKGRNAVPVGNDGRPTAPHVEDGDLIEVGKHKGKRFLSGEFMPR